MIHVPIGAGFALNKCFISYFDNFGVITEKD
jgi:hypothetical protein